MSREGMHTPYLELKVSEYCAVQKRRPSDVLLVFLLRGDRAFCPLVRRFTGKMGMNSWATWNSLSPANSALSLAKQVLFLCWCCDNARLLLKSSLLQYRHIRVVAIIMSPYPKYGEPRLRMPTLWTI